MNLNETIEREVRRFVASGALGEDDVLGALAQCAEMLSSGVEAGDESPLNRALMEEVVLYWTVCRIFTHRVAMGLAGGDGEGEPEKPPVWLEPLAKTRERLRKVLKELEDRVGLGASAGYAGLGKEMQPLLEAAEEVIDDVFYTKRPAGGNAAAAAGGSAATAEGSAAPAEGEEDA